MFFIAHIFFASKRSGGYLQPWPATGAILPDCAFTGTIGWPDLHAETAAEPFGRALDDGERSRALTNGIRDHIVLDNRSHHQFDGGGGYAFSHQTPQLVSLTARACQVLDDQVARGLAHNFIESGVDINLLAHQPELQEASHRAVKAVDLDWLAAGMAKYWHKNPEQTRRRLGEFVGLVIRYDLATLEGWADCWMELTPLLLGYGGDRDAAKAALQLAVELTAGDYERVLE